MARCDHVYAGSCDNCGLSYREIVKVVSLDAKPWEMGESYFLLCKCGFKKPISHEHHDEIINRELAVLRKI